MRKLALLLPLVAGVGAASAPADEVRLRDGRVLVGSTVTVGKTLRVTTLDGVVVVPASDVVRVRTDDELRGELQGLQARTGATFFGALQLARTARDWGLHAEMWEHVDACLARGAEAPAPRAELRAFLAELEPVVLPRKWREASTEIRVRELLYRVKPRGPRGVAAAVEAILAAEPGADAVLRDRARAALRPEQRLAAVRALAQRAAEGNDRFVCRTAIVDGSGEVRAGAAQAVREHGDTEGAVRYLAPGLMHDSPYVRIRTAEAYGHMLDDSAIDLLVAAGPSAGTPLRAGADTGAVRGHVAILQQESYVRDFDVEVAQASFIADPKVDVLQSGVVLDTTVHAVIAFRTEIVRAYRGALRHLGGSDPGWDPKKWADWRAGLRPQGGGD